MQSVGHAAAKQQPKPSFDDPYRLAHDYLLWRPIPVPLCRVSRLPHDYHLATKCRQQPELNALGMYKSLFREHSQTTDQATPARLGKEEDWLLAVGQLASG